MSELRVTRTTSGLREMLFEEIDALRNGTSNPQRLRAIASGSNAIIRTVLMEIAIQNTVCDLSLLSPSKDGKIGKLALVA